MSVTPDDLRYLTAGDRVLWEGEPTGEGVVQLNCPAGLVVLWDNGEQTTWPNHDKALAVRIGEHLTILEKVGMQ